MQTRTAAVVAIAVFALNLAGYAQAASSEAPSGTTVAPTPAPTPAPGNDDLANAQVVHSLPASIQGTTVGATTQPEEVVSACAGPTTSSVWYSLRTSSAQRIAIDLAAAGALDASIDVYHAVRSQLHPVSCQETESAGKASLTFKTSKNGLYDIRVAARAGSQLNAFALEVFLPTPEVQPPGRPLPAAGINGQVDRVQNVNAAYSVTLHSGVSYLLNLANTTKGACVDGDLFAPGTRSFEEGSSLLDIGCGGYKLFTPGPGKGGLYSFEVTPDTQRAGVQRFHLQVAAAGPAETAPGIALGNYGRAHGQLDGRGIQVLRLYRLDIASHSNLTLKLSAPETAHFNLQLRTQSGDVLECQCGGSGSQTLQRQMLPGRYYAVVSVRGPSAGAFTLERQSRTITRTQVFFEPAHAAAGQALAIDVRVTPAVSGPVTVDIQRFDPVFGWQFYRQVNAQVVAGVASIAFAPPALGRWRANAAFAGSRLASPSGVGFSYLLAG
jgi:hypothetical protein